MPREEMLIDNSAMRLEKLELGPFGTNAYVLVCRQSGESIIFDAPGEAEKIIARLGDTHPRCILLTHAHGDHTGALEELRSQLQIPLAAHPAEADRLSAPSEIPLRDGGRITCGKLSLSVLHTPGHTPGSTCFYTDRLLLAGDTLFPGGPGKTGSPDNFRQIVESITQKLFPLPDDTRVYPGHGPGTTIKEEKENYAVFAARPRDPNLCGDVTWAGS